MNKPAIKVQGLSKLYQLTHQQSQQSTFREAVTDMLTAPWRRINELRGESSTLEEFWALRDVSFEVEPGQVVGVIGRNGAGKSTLLKILSRIVEPTGGSVVMRGRVASLLEVGTGFHPELSGRENIYLNGSILGMKKRDIDRQFDQIVDFAEVERFLDTPVKRYSSGMYVRLAFAVAAHLEPDILIVDEVLAVGDAAFQKKCIGKIKSISDAGARAVVFVSHDMAAVRSLCTRVIYLKGGSIENMGSVDDVLHSYLNPPQHERQKVLRSKHGLELAGLEVIAESHGVPARQILFDAPVSIRVQLATVEPFHSAGIVLRVEDDRGLLVSTICSVEEGLDPISFNESIEVRFRIDRMRLMPGTYRIGVFVYKPNDATAYLEAEAFAEFEVTAAVVNGSAWPYRSHHGVFRMAADCTSSEMV